MTIREVFLKFIALLLANYRYTIEQYYAQYVRKQLHFETLGTDLSTPEISSTQRL